jgi:hypothetical protein
MPESTVINGTTLSQLPADARLQPLLLNHQPELAVETPEPPEPVPEPELAQIVEGLKPTPREASDDPGRIVTPETSACDFNGLDIC